MPAAFVAAKITELHNFFDISDLQHGQFLVFLYTRGATLFEEEVKLICSASIKICD